MNGENILWIAASLNAALFFALRFVYIKHLLSHVSSGVLALSGRFFSLLFLLPLMPFKSLAVPDAPLFWKTIAVTASLTVIASLLQLKAVKKYDLSSSLPFMSFIPLFMVISVYLIFGEMPASSTFPGVVLLCAGAYIIGLERNMSLFLPFKNLLNNRGGLLFLGVAFIYGFTTTLDRVAIDSAGGGAFAYSFYWNLFSVGLFLMMFFNVKKAAHYRREIKTNIFHLAVQGFLGIVAFYSQMIAIEGAQHVAANVIYVKALTLFQMLVGVLFGIFFFREGNARSRLAGAFFMFAGAVILILFVQSKQV